MADIKPIRRTHRFKDLSGQTFGDWLVLCCLGSRSAMAVWLCRCVCKREVEVLGRNLRNGSSTNCGCRNKLDLRGAVFERLTVVEEVAPGLWRCDCVCGNKPVVQGKLLRNGHTRSCGCIRRERARLGGPNPRPRPDIQGQQFGDWAAGEPATGPHQKRYWHVTCKCGTKAVRAASALISGRTRSCRECSRRETAQANFTRHGKCGTREYNIWCGMIARCYSPKAINYGNYGARGVRMCERWRKSFEDFLADMGEAPSPQHSLDRYPDQTGDYEPGNCRWATRKQQARNNRRNRLLTDGGETIPVSEWGERTGVPGSLIAVRIDKLGWSVHDAIHTPVRKRAGLSTEP